MHQVVVLGLVQATVSLVSSQAKLRVIRALDILRTVVALATLLQLIGGVLLVINIVMLHTTC